MRRRVCTGAPVHYEQTVEASPNTALPTRCAAFPHAAGVYRCTMSKQSGGGCRECVPVHNEQTVSAPPNTALPTRCAAFPTRRVCTGAL